MKFFVVFISLNCALFVPYAQAISPTAQIIPIRPDPAERPIWQMRDSNGIILGTGFFVEKKYFITNAQVIYAVTENNTVKDISLSQEGNPSVIKIKKVHRLSALYGLVLLETEEAVSNYLSVRDQPPQYSDQLHVPFYSGTFKTAKTTGNILYENSLFYAFPFNHLDLDGMGGPPLLDEQGQVVGVIFSGTHNILHAIKTDHLKKLIAGETGIKCSSFISTKICLKREMENLKESAEDGDPVAQFILADMYYNAEGTEKSLEMAVHWFKEAALQGFAPAEYELSVSYYKGEGVEQSDKWAFHWCERAAKRGYIQAKYNLAMMYKEGIGTKKNLMLAFDELRLPAALGFIPAQSQFAEMHEKGLGTEKNLEQALFWYEKAGHQGDTESQFKAAIMHEKGIGTEKDLEQALFWYEKAGHQGHTESQFKAGIMHEKGIGIEPSPETAAFWYRKAANKRHAEAAYRLAMMNETGLGIEKNFEMAAFWYGIAMEKKHAKATYRLAMMYKEGKGVEQKIKRSMELFTLAKDLGHAPQNDSPTSCYDELAKN